jgi:hypothetical protein
MYVYRRSEPQLWTVGFYDPSGQWQPESDHDNRDLAAERVHWLNGGNLGSVPIDQTQFDDGGSWEEYQHIKRRQQP